MAKQKNTRSKIEVKFWGVRGSIATHHAKNIRYGGHTACVSIRFNNRWFVCDAGTGIRLLGQKLTKDKSPISIFISHLHWDHIFGLPFFKPLYQKSRKIILAGPSHRNSFKNQLGKIIRSPYFPIGPISWNSQIRWLNLKETRLSIGKVEVETRWVDHPDKALGFKFHFPGGEKIIYVTDQELNPADKKFAKWIQGADLLIHDSQYSLKEYKKYKGWGHSAFESVLKMARNAGVKKFVLFHHDPSASDTLLDKRLNQCRKNIKRHKSSMKCFSAKEGLVLAV